MLYGGVNYRLKANLDNEVYVPWAGRVVFAPRKGDEDIKMQFYQVYLVSTLLCCQLKDDVCGADLSCRIPRLSPEKNRANRNANHLRPVLYIHKSCMKAMSMIGYKLGF